MNLTIQTTSRICWGTLIPTGTPRLSVLASLKSLSSLAWLTTVVCSSCLRTLLCFFFLALFLGWTVSLLTAALTCVSSSGTTSLPSCLASSKLSAHSFLSKA